MDDTTAGGLKAERKAAIKALVAEIRITDEGLIPVFRIPRPRTPSSAVTALQPARFAQRNSQ
jgi:site-specific DNA recombinase